MFLILFISIFVLLLTWDYLNKRQRVASFAKSRINGPRSLPIFGCGLEALQLGAENIIQYIGACFQKYGNTFRFWILNEAQVYTIDTQLFESVLSSTTLLEKADLYDYLRPFLNDGLLLSVGKKWHARRKVFTTAFHFKVLEHYVDIMDKQSSIMVKKLSGVADGVKVIDMLQYVSLAALDVITEAAMGVQVNAQLDPEFPYVKALKSVVYIQPNRMFNISQRYDWLFKLTSFGVYRKLVKDIRIMHDFTTHVIEERRATVERAIANGTYKPLSLGDSEVGTKSQMALLDILLQAKINGASLSNEDIREEVDTFMFEGDDTTTSGVSHALHCISRHPDVQTKLINEIWQVMGKNKDTPVTMQQLQELKYTECVIKETMRLHPPVPAVGRRTTKDLQVGDITIPANTSIYLVIIFAHRSPDNFPEPELFKPERFEEHGDIDDVDNVDDGKRKTFAYTPFSAGPKNCIGQKFAMLEMKALISKVLRHYELLPLGAEVQPMMNFILRSPCGINIGLKPRV